MPLKGIDALYVFWMNDQRVGKIVRAYDGISALDVVCQIGQGAVAEGKQAQGKALVGLSFQHL